MVFIVNPLLIAGRAFMRTPGQHWRRFSASYKKISAIKADDYKMACNTRMPTARRFAMRQKQRAANESRPWKELIMKEKALFDKKTAAPAGIEAGIDNRPIV